MIGGDALLNGFGVRGVGEMGDLSAVDGVDEERVHLVTTGVRSVATDTFRFDGLLAGRAPNVAVIDIVVVGEADGGPVAYEVAEGPAPADPVVEIVDAGSIGRCSDDACKTTLVDLVTGEE